MPSIATVFQSHRLALGSVCVLYWISGVLSDKMYHSGLAVILGEAAAAERMGNSSVITSPAWKQLWSVSSRLTPRNMSDMTRQSDIRPARPFTPVNQVHPDEFTRTAHCLISTHILEGEDYIGHLYLKVYSHFPQWQIWCWYLANHEAPGITISCAFCAWRSTVFVCSWSIKCSQINVKAPKARASDIIYIASVVLE